MKRIQNILDRDISAAEKVKQLNRMERETNRQIENEIMRIKELKAIKRRNSFKKTDIKIIVLKIVENRFVNV
jgi:hypothetical protein